MKRSEINQALREMEAMVYTADGKMSAQWEVTVAVTEHGYEILAD